MATFYLDYEGGNDANDGTTFANRWKTITNGATAARIAPGDTIRIMGSPAPTSLGTTGSWTNKSATVTLGSARNVLITDCETAWTAAANVTATNDGTYYRGLSGEKSAKLAIAAGFTTGKAAYFALGAAQDYSAYQGITLWVMIKTAVSLAASTLSIRLCSDTTGDTTVDTLAIPAQSYVDRWWPIHIDKGSALGASIQSIALYADLDPGTIDVYLDNISTTKAAGDDCLTLKTLIGKNTANETWWGIRKISGTTVTLDSYPGMEWYQTGYAQRGYSGTTESVTTYIRKTIPTTQVQYSFTIVQEIQDSGTAGNLITFSGGWNRTDMTTQSLDGTFFDGETGAGVGLRSSLKSYFALDKLGFYRYSSGADLYATFTQLGTLWSGNCGTGFVFSPMVDSSITTLYASGCYNRGVLLYGTRLLFTTIRAVSSGDTVGGYGLYIDNQSGNVTINEAYLNNNGTDGLNGNNVGMSYLTINTLVAADNARYGLTIDSISWLGWLLKTVTLTGNGQYGSHFGKGQCLIHSLTTSGNGSGAIYSGITGDAYRDITVIKSSMAETTKFYNVGSGAWLYQSSVRFHNYNGVVGDHRHYSGGETCSIFSESSVRHTASGLAWKISPASTTVLTADFPFMYNIMRVAVNGTGTLTISAWMRRTNTGLTAKLVCRGGQLDGIPIDQTATMTAGADTWEKLTLILGPTAAGVLDIDVHLYGGSTYSLYIDDMGATQV